MGQLVDTRESSAPPAKSMVRGTGSDKSALRSMDLAQQTAALSPAPPVGRASGLWERPSTLGHNLGSGPAIEKLAVDFELGPDVSRADTTAEALQTTATGLGSDLDTALKEFGEVPFSQQEAAITSAFSGQNTPVVRRMVHRQLTTTPLDVNPEVPVKTSVVSLEPLAFGDRVITCPRHLTPGPNRLGLDAVVLVLTLSGLKPTDVDGATAEGKNILTRHPLFLRKGSRYAIPLLDDALTRVTTEVAMNSEDVQEFGVRVRDLATGVAASACGLPAAVVSIQVGNVNRRALEHFGAGGRVVEEQGATRLSNHGMSEQGHVRHALLIDNSAYGEGGPLPMKAREAASTLEQEDYYVDVQEGLDKSGVARAIVGVLAMAQAGDSLRVVFSARPAPGADAALSPADAPIPLAMLRDVLHRGKAKGIDTEVTLDVPRTDAAKVDLEKLDIAATREFIDAIDARAEDDDITLDLVALAYEVRCRVMEMEYRTEQDTALVDRVKARVKYERVDRISLHICDDLSDAHKLLEEAIEVRRARQAQGVPLEDTSVVSSSTSRHALANDGDSFTQQILGGLAENQRPEYALNHHNADHQAPVLTTSSHAKRETARNKTALVVGNAWYRQASYLPGAKRDAADMAAVWSSQGYHVEHVEDLDAKGLGQAIETFFGEANPEDDRAFYYAGHGMTEGLVAVDEAIVPHGFVAAAVARAKHGGTKVTVIVDACQSGDVAEMAGAGMEGRDLIPELKAQTDDPAEAQELIEIANELRDAHLVMTPGSSKQDLWRMFLRLEEKGVKLALHGSSSHEALVFAFNQVEERLATLRADAHKAKWLGGDELV